MAKKREQLPKSVKPVTLPKEVLSGAQAMAADFREASKSREISVPEGTPENAKVLHDFDVWAEGYGTLHLTAEDETECIRQFRLCYGITTANVNIKAKYRGDDQRPRPRQEKGPEAPAAGKPAT